MNREIIKARSGINKSIRNFFTEKGYLEVETPLLSPSLIPESTIEVFETEYHSLKRKPVSLYLIPSPEVFMKQLIADGIGDIFQLTKSFRNYEQSGKYHNPEFTMLEWYTMNASAADNIPITEELFERIIHDRGKAGIFSPKIDPRHLTPPFRRMSMEELFFEKSGIDLAANLTLEVFRETARNKGYRINDADENWESVFNRIFLTEVEPFLPSDKPLIIYNYPSGIGCLAKDIPSSPWKDRWELYCSGVELANCYTEETDPQKAADLFKKEHRIKKQTSEVTPHYESVLNSIFKKSFPESSGVALGVDRLIQIFTGTDRLEGVILFPLSDILAQ
ncbi:MAG: elongation factor P--(R)-beta-lysine ligase [Spirochaetes bacterium]|nr:MAG: elongation factor P--(R)-beta-lysine ligase [Spirochaetota bacterium]